MNQDHAERIAVFQSSLQRVLLNPDFFDRFYDRFIDSSPGIAEVFKDLEMRQLKQKLRMTLEMVADIAEGKPGLGMYLEMLGKIHQRLKIEPDYFRLWQQALLATVAEKDPAFDARVEDAWRASIEEVIEQMGGNR
ncbi:MAG: globin [Pseudomonadota bacterium]